MKFLIIFVLIFIKYCDSNDFKCGYFDEKQKSVEFYCADFHEGFPVNCTKSFFYSINFYDKSKVTKMKIGGCDGEQISQLVEDFRSIRSLDISCSDLQSLGIFKMKLENLMQLNASHNRLSENPSDIWRKMPQLTEVDLSFNNLKLVWFLPATVKKIVMSHNRMEFISGYDLIYHKKLEIFDLSHNFLEEIDHTDIFMNANNLKVLRLENNRYKTFDRKLWLLIKRGVTVYFSWKYVTEFEINSSLDKPIHVFTNIGNEKEGIWFSSDGKIEIHCSEGSFENIKRFTFIDNHIENPSELLRCLTPSIKRLELSGKFDESQLNFVLFERFINLWELTIYDAQITVLDINSLHKLTLLFSLNLCNNNLTRIYNLPLLDNETKIFQWNLAKNKLQNAPELIQHWKFFTDKVNLTGSYVGKLNKTSFKNVKYMSVINLSNTNLSFDDLQPFEPLEYLHDLDISYNNLNNTNFTSNSMAFKKLHTLNAAHCNIANATDLIKLLGSSILTLNLSGNHLDSFNANTFKGLIHLQTLNVSKTNLIEIDFGIFRHQIFFYEADFSYNKLKTVHVTSAVIHLGIVHLDGNELTDTQSFSEHNFPILSKMSISNNQIPCTALAQLKRQRPDLIFIDNILQQQHGDCSNVDRLIDNLGFVGTLISKWF